MGFLQELAAQKAELVDKTPFDSLENQLAYEIIDKKLAEIYDLIQNNPDITKEYVNQALEPVQDSLEKLPKLVLFIIKLGNQTSMYYLLLLFRILND